MRFDLGSTSCFAVNQKQDMEKLQRLQPSAAPMTRDPEHVTYSQGFVQLLIACHSLRGSCKAKSSLVEPRAAIQEALDEMLEWTAVEEEPKGDVVPTTAD